MTAVDNISPVLRTISQSMGAFSGDATRMVSSLAQLGAAALPIMAIGGAFIYAGQQASMVQQNVANLNAVLHATSEQLAAIRNNGLALSQATQFTDAQILASQRQLAKGGANPADLAAPGSQGVTGATLNLAAATQSDPTAAATSMTAASTAFQIPIADAAKTATTLASAVDSSVGSLASQAAALKQVGVVAKAAGFDLKDTVTTIADLQNNGMMNDSGTGLKTFLSRIEAPSGVAKQQIDALGLSFYDLQGNLKPIPELFDEIHTKMSSLDSQTANDALTKIFGLRGVRVADVALEQGSGGYIETAQSMAEKGDAAEIAARKLDTFQGSASKAASSLNVLAVQFGSVLLPGMKDFADLTEGTANKLSQLNNAAAIVPQVAVGLAAIAGISKVGSFIDDRQDSKKTAAQSQLDQANQQRIAQTADYNNAVVAAEFDADSKIAAAHANMVKGLEEIDQQRFDAWIALEGKTVDAVNAAEAKQLQSVQSITAAYMESIDRIDRAQAAASADSIARSQADADRQRALLSVNQEAETAKAKIPSSGPVALAQSQDIERQALEKRLAIQQDYETNIDQIRNEGYDRQKTEAAVAAQNAIDQKEAEGRTVLAAVETNQARQEDALVASFAKQEEIVRAGYAAQAAAAEATLANKTGLGNPFLAGPTLTGKPIPNPDMVAGSISDDAKAFKVPAGVTLTAGTVAADEGLIAGLKSKGAAVIGTAMAAAGEFIVPALIALTVVEMIIKPIDQAIIDRAVKNDSQLNNLTANVDSITTDRGQSYADQVANTAQSKQDIQKEIDARTAALKKEEADRSFGLPVIGGLDQGIRSITGIQPADIGAQEKAIADLRQQLASLDQQSKKTDLMPEAALSKANDTLTTLLTQVDAGTLSVADFTSAWATAGKEVGEDTVDQLEKQGVAQDKANKLVADGIDLAKQHAKALEDARQQAEADYMSSAQTAQSQLALGATPDQVDVANFSKHADQTDATKVEVANAKKSIEELKTAWTNAQQVVNGIDISKGFDAFAKLSDSIALANRELANVGQSSAALADLGRYADMFKQVTDAEEAASAAMNGYNLTLTQSQTYMNDLTGVQKEFETALEQAERRQAAGRATSADQELIKNAPNIRGNLANQQDTISQHMVLDVLGTVKNLPDFASLDTYMRDIVEKGGGGITIVATIQSDAKTARQQMEDILKPPITVTIIPDISQFSPALLDSIRKYGGATQGGTYNDTGGNNGPPAGGPPALPPTAANSYTQQPGNSNPLTYHDLNNDQYATIVAQSTGGKSSPFTDPSVRDQLLAAAKEANVDPRLMLDATRYENNDATNISNSLLQANNFAGLKYDPHIAGESKGPESSEGDNYAAFGSAKDFFKTLAANLSTGEYKNDFDQGNTEGIFNRYQAGNAPPSKDQAASTMNRNNTYWDWVQKFPSGASGGLGAGGVVTGSEGGGAGVPSDTMVDGVAAGVRAQIVQKALSQVDQDKMVAYCEQWVEETVQGITGKRGATGTNEASATTAFAHGQAMGLETKNPQPGDLVYYPDANGGSGHVAIYMGGGQQVSTWDQGAFPGNSGPDRSAPGDPTNSRIHTEAVGPNARYLSVGAGGVNYGTGDPGNRGNATGGTALIVDPNYYTDGKKLYQTVGSGAPGTINAEQTPDVAPLPTKPYPTEALPSLTAYSQQMNGMNATDQGQMQTFFDKLLPVFQGVESNKMYGPDGPHNQTEKSLADNAGMKDTLDLTTAMGPAIQAMNSGLTVTPEMFAKIQAAAGPLAPMITAQVAATANLAQETQHLTDLKAAQADADTKHQQDLQARQAQETNISNDHTKQGITEQMQQREITANREVITRKEQDDDTARQRKQTLDQRAIDDSRTAQQRQWQDEQTQLDDNARVAAEAQRQQDVADTNHKQALDDAYTVVQRQEQDQQRLLNFRGGQDMITLQDAKKTLDDQHRIATEGMQQNEGLYVSLGKGSSTEAQATAYASQAAAIDDARKKADDLYAKQSDANTRAQDALSKYNAQVMFDLQTQQIAADRAHQDDLKNIDEAATKRQQDYNNQLYQLSSEAAVRTASHLAITRQQEDEDKARQRGIEDEQFGIDATRLKEQRRWQDDDTARSNAIQDEQNRWTLEKMQRDSVNKETDDRYAADKLANQQEQTDTNTNISNLNKQITGIDTIIGKYQTLLTMFGDAASQVLGSAPAITPTGSGNGATNSRRLGGFATGTAFSPGGDAEVNERGGELRTLLSGETIIPADQTKRMFDALLSARSNVTPISAAPSYHEGNVTIQMGDSSLSLSASAQAKIRAIVQDEMESQQPVTYTARQAATGGLKR